MSFPGLVKAHLLILAMLGCLVVVALLGSEAGARSDPIVAPAEVQVGDRLFRETRFAQFFFNFIQAPKRNVNTPLVHGDPVMNNEQNAGKPLRDPFRNQSMNCRNCHLGNDLLGVSRLMDAPTAISRGAVRFPHVPMNSRPRRATPRCW